MIALKILDMLLRLYMLIVLAVVIIRVLQVTPNKWTNLLDRMTCLLYTSPSPRDRG